MVIGRSHSIKDYPGQLTGLMMFSALAGALAAMFTTPKTGYEVRTRLKERGRRMKYRWQEYLRKDDDTDMGDLTTQARNRMTETAQKIKQEAVDTARETKQAANSRKPGGSKSKEGES